MKKWLAKAHLIIKNDFIRSVSVLTSGTVLSHIAIVLTTPILTRIYGPAEFGIYAVYTSILYTISGIASLHYETAIPLSKKKIEAINVTVVALIILCSTVLFLAMCVLFFQQLFIRLLDIPNFNIYLYFLPFSVLGLGLFQVFQLWGLRKEAYSNIAKGRVRMNIAQMSAQIGLGLISNSSSFLIGGEVLGRIVGGLGLSYSFKKDIVKNIKFVSLKKIKAMGIRYKKFPLISSWSSVFEGITTNLPVIFIASTLGVKVAGWYLVATRVLVLPEALLGNSVKQVYYAKASKLLHRSLSDVIHLFWKTVKNLFFTALILFALITIISPTIFPFLFGMEWKEAGLYVICMALLYFLQFIIVPISINFYLLELLHIQVFVEICRFLLLMIGIIFSHFLLTEAWHIILCISLAGAIGSLLVGIASWYSLYSYR